MATSMPGTTPHPVLRADDDDDLVATDPVRLSPRR
jgi:hypothetical protein